MTWIEQFFNCSVQKTYCDAIVIRSRMLPGLICNAGRLELANVLTRKNVNKLQHFEAGLHLLA